MNIEEAREYCLSLKNVTECFPFDDVSLVFKVENKMFALLPLDAEEPYVALKCSTDYTEELRDRYNAVEPAYHFNKKTTPFTRWPRTRPVTAKVSKVFTNATLSRFRFYRAFLP